MNKKDLENGMIIECKEGLYMVYGNALLSRHGHNSLHSYDDGLKLIDRSLSDFDVVNVYKCEAPTYIGSLFDKNNLTLIWERGEILDSKEKKYLSAVIKPFRNTVKSITKCSSIGAHNDWINIAITNDGGNVSLPYFRQSTMYKNMESNKAYTLEELGL